MAAENGHAPNRAYIAQDGSFHLNGASFWGTETVDIKTPLGLLAPITTYTQTYSTAASTVPAATYAAPTVTGVATTNVTKTNSSPYGFSSSDADAVVTFLGAAPAAILSLNTQLVALAADVLALKKVITNIIDDMQALGLAS
jgi:hypothetical protein